MSDFHINPTNLEHLSEGPSLIIPNRIDLNTLKRIYRSISLDRPVIWLADTDNPPDAKLYAYIVSKQQAGIAFSSMQCDAQTILLKLKPSLDAGNHIVFIPPAQELNYNISNSPPALLKLLCEVAIPIIPLYTYTQRKKRQIRKLAIFQELSIAFLRTAPRLSSEKSRHLELHRSWHASSSIEAEKHEKLQDCSLANLVLRALQKYPNSSIVDGVSDHIISYDQLLSRVIPLAKHLRKNYPSCERIGIILPPGKYAILSNLACIIAGIVPVNINIDYRETQFESVIQQAKLTHFITEKRFQQKIPNFPWPKSRDLIILNDILARFIPWLCSFYAAITHLCTSEYCKKLIGSIERSEDDEAILLFSRAADGHAHPLSFTHKALVASHILHRRHLSIKAQQSILCALPYSNSTGICLGLLFPLLQGGDLIAYGDSINIERICSLCKLYQVEHIITTPQQITLINKSGIGRDSFASVRRLISCGALLSSELRHQSYKNLGLSIINAYTHNEACGALTLSIPYNPKPENRPKALPGIVELGQPFEGVAYRITDITDDEINVPEGSPGILWFRGPSISSKQYDWFCTDNVAYINPNGELILTGHRKRFSKVDGVLISHEAIEQELRQIFLPKDYQGEPCFAVISEREGDHNRIIAFSTVHSAPFSQNELLSLRYLLKNRKFPSEWAPYIFIPLNHIPALKDGRHHDELCYKIARTALECRRNAR